MSIKIVAFTGIRSDYSLMSDVYKEINKNPFFEIGLIVSGAHLSQTYGYTVSEIEKDGLNIVEKIESLIDSNSRASRLKSMSILLQNCISSVERFNPDLIIYAGDREDVMVGSLVGAYLGIPSIHFFGGDHAEDGHLDNPVRHATSKLASLHFVIHEEHKKRLLSLGEPENRIRVVGNPALDKFLNTKPMLLEDVTKVMNRPSWKNYALTIYHPMPGQETRAGEDFEEILLSLKQKGIKSFVSFPNVDAGNKSIIQKIEKFQDDRDFCFYKNLNRDLFINVMRNASFMIGNSSAGLLEAPFIPLGAINVGLRQSGRKSDGNVVFVENGINNISKAIDIVQSGEFQEGLKHVTSSFGDGTTVSKVINIMKEINFKKFVYKFEDPLGVSKYG
jgi:GDP/UDP-N,N'-diacetylbacillosamine 2-epimerase (hydrolysing)